MDTVKTSACKRMNWVSFFYTIILLWGHSIITYAHIGSSGVIVQKQAGKYQLLISINPPDVVPGTAKVTVFVERGRISSIGARPIYFYSGDKGAPTHDVLKVVSDNRYEGDLWLMTSGSSSVELNIDGPDGKQQIVVPVMALATAVRDMPAGMGWGLAAMGLLLIVMLITIIGASNAEGVSSPSQPTLIPVIRRRRLVGMSVGLVTVLLILAGWRTWWNSTAEEYRTEQLYRPMPIQSSVRLANAQRQLTIQFDTTGFSDNWQNRRLLSYVIPDHGKLMHAFLVRMPGLDAFAHLHPSRHDTLHYQTALPTTLPGGKYLLYSDVVYQNGFAETLTDTVDVSALKISAESAANTNLSDPDDSWSIIKPMRVKANAANVPHLDKNMAVCGKPSASTKLADGSSMIWMDKPGIDSPAQVPESGRLYRLKFALADSLGKAASLEPYLGMGGHAVILRSDGTVYIHLHPVGTYSIAAEESMIGRLGDTTRIVHYANPVTFRDSIDSYITKLKSLPEAEKNRQLMAASPEMNHAMKINNMVEFPYAFPRAGHYRIWVQVKRNGRILTGVFDTQVQEPLL